MEIKRWIRSWKSFSSSLFFSRSWAPLVIVLLFDFIDSLVGVKEVSGFLHAILFYLWKETYSFVEW